MKKLIIAAFVFAFPSVASAITYQSVRASTSTVLDPGIQTGTMNLSSGTIKAFVANDVRANFGVVGTTGTFSGLVTAGSFSPASALPSGNTNYINVTSSLQSGATFYVSSGTVASSLNILNGATVDAGSNRITNVSTPTAVADAATKGYIDSIANGSTNYIQARATLQSGATFYVSSGTAVNLTATEFAVNSSSIAVYFMPPVYSSVTIGIVISSITTSSATAVATGIWVPSHATLTITPKFTTSRVRLQWEGDMTASNFSRDCYASFFRGTTNLGNVNGMNHTGNGTETGPVTVPMGLLYYDSPNTTSATTYTVYFKTSGSVTCTINSQLSVEVMEAQEIR